MRIKVRVLILSIAGLATLLVLPVRAEGTPEISKEQLGAISQSCDSIKQSLKKLQKADTKTRSYLGGIYEDFLTDFISPLNLRLVKNSLPSPTLTSLHSDLINKRQDFAQKFTLYAQSLDALLAVDCQNNPNEFYTKLLETRKARNTLEQSVEAVRMLLEKYQNAVQALKEDL